jgi:predicted nuclease of predicted toxin-antitoxin system
VKFLVDHNLSPKVADHLQANFPGSVQTMALGFDRTSDHDLFRYAKENGFHILTKDTDFEQLSLLRGAPPKVVWLRVGNASTRVVMHLLDIRQVDILQFLEDEQRSFLALGL